MKTRIKYGSRSIAALILTVALVLGSFTKLPAESYASSSSDIAVGDFIDIGKTDVPEYTGVPHWRVLDRAEDGSMLLMSEYLWRGNGSDGSIGVSFMERGEWYKPDGQRDFRGTNAETWCNDFETSVLNVDALTIIPQNASDDEYIHEQTKYSEGNKKLKFRQANAVLYQNKVFFLSAEQADLYLGEGYDGKVAYMPEGTEPAAWYLRSTEISTGNNSATEVKADGELAYVNADQTRAARPVFWAKFDEGTSFVAATDESGAKTWSIGEDQADPSGEQTDPSGGEGSGQSGGQNSDAQKAPAPVVTQATVNARTASAAAIQQAIQDAGGNVDILVLGKSVQKIGKNALKGAGIKTIIVQTKKLKKKSVKGSLKGSDVTTVIVQIGKAKTNKKYMKKYKKIFTKKNAGKKVKVKN